MLNARQVSDWFRHQAEQKCAREQEQVAGARERSLASRRQHRAAMAWRIQEINSRIHEVQQRLKMLPPSYLHNRFDLTSKKRLQCQLARFDKLEAFIANGFNQGLLSFGSPWFTLLAMLASLGLAFQWMQNHFGLDVIGGSQFLTLLVVVGMALMIDLISFLLLGALLASLKNFIGEDRHIAVVARIMTIASLTGVVGFISLLINRFLESGI